MILDFCRFDKSGSAAIHHAVCHGDGPLAEALGPGKSTNAILEMLLDRDADINAVHRAHLPASGVLSELCAESRNTKAEGSGRTVTCREIPSALWNRIDRCEFS